MKTDLSLVIPCYNESEVLPALEQRLLQCLNTLGVNWEVIFVDDGSQDRTAELLAGMHEKQPRFKAISFSRNFGHQAAISAGLVYASGEAVGIMDADLQDPPELFGACLDKLKEGYDVVYAVRRKRKEHLAKRFAYRLFYRLLQKVAEGDIPLDAGDFCLMRQRVVKVLRAMPERNLFVRGLRAWTGFRQVGLEYEREARAAGTPKYSLGKLVRLATDGVFAFTTLPLRFATYVGFAGLGLSVVAGIFILAWRLFGFEFMGHRAVELPGWAAAVGGMFFLSAIQFLILGCLGEYIGRIYNEVKQRPRWIIRDCWGLPLALREGTELPAQ
ncbi:putative enzyme [Verrucomicrobia bacterium]|nr:putative enzyme [Verrucomicrobiota bacterium]